MKYYARTHFIIALVIVLVASLAYAFWSSYVAQQRELMTSLSLEIATKNQDAARIQEVKNALTDLARAEDSLNSRYISMQDIVPFLESLSTTGKRLGTKVSVVSVSANSTPPGGHVVIALQVAGSFDAVMRTIGVLEQAPTDVVVSAVTLDTPGSTSGKAPVWTAAATLAVGLQPTGVASTTPHK